MTKPYFSHKKSSFFKKPHPLSLYISYLYILRLPTSDRGHQLFFGEPYRSKPNLLWNEQDVGHPAFIPTLQTHVRHWWLCFSQMWQKVITHKKNTYLFSDVSVSGIETKRNRQTAQQHYLNLENSCNVCWKWFFIHMLEEILNAFFVPKNCKAKHARTALHMALVF